jgi:hypothetical protein
LIVVRHLLESHTWEWQFVIEFYQSEKDRKLAKSSHSAVLRQQAQWRFIS